MDTGTHAVVRVQHASVDEDDDDESCDFKHLNVNLQLHILYTSKLLDI